MLANELARQYGMEVRIDGLQHPHPRGWRITGITVDLHDGSRLLAEDVQMGWVCCDTWRHPLVLTVARLRVNSATVSLDTSRQPHSVQAPVPVVYSPSMKTVLEGWHHRLPWLQVAIDTLHFDHPLYPLSVRRFDAVHDQRGMTLTGDSAWRNLDFTFMLQWRKENRLQARLQTGYGHLSLDSEWQDGDNAEGHWITLLSQDVDLARVLPALGLQSLFAPLRMQPASLRVQGDGHIVLPDRPGSRDWQAHLVPRLSFSAESPGLAIVMEPEITLQGRSLPQTLTLRPLRALLHAEAWPTPLAGILPPDLVLEIQDPLTCTYDTAHSECSRRVSILLTATADPHPGSSDSVRTGRLAASVELLPDDDMAVMELDLQLALAKASLPKQVSLATAFTLDWGNGLVLDASRDTQMAWTGLPLSFPPGHDSMDSRGAPALSADDLSVQADGKVDLADLRLTLADWRAPHQWVAQAGLDAQVALHAPDLRTDLELHAEVNASDSALSLSRGRFAALGLVVPFTLDATTDLSEGALAYRLSGRLRDAVAVTRWLPGGGAGVRLVPGDIDVAGRVEWGAKGEDTPSSSASAREAREPAAFVATARGTLNDWSVGRDSLSVHGVDAAFDVRVDPATVHLQTPLRIDAAEVIAPVRLAQAQLRLQGMLDYRLSLRCALTVDAASATLFGGRVRLARPAAVGCPDPAAVFWMELLDLDLGQLVALENQHIDASGQIAGLVPLKLADGQLSINGGQVAAQGEGWIRLRDVPQWKAMAGDNEQLLFALNALENFKYRVLTSSVDLTPTGWLHLGLSLQGNNPEVKAGQDIHYNLNVESNLPSLMKSMRMAEDLSDQLQDKLQ